MSNRSFDRRTFLKSGAAAAAALGLGSFQLHGQNEQKAPLAEPTARRRSQPAFAVTWAASFLEQVPAENRQFMRFFWDPYANPVNGKVLSFALNSALNHSGTVQQPLLINGTENQVYVVDLRNWWPDIEVFKELHQVWESMDILEPYFHTLVQVNETKLVPTKVTKDVLVNVRPYRHKNGKTYNQRWKTTETTENIEQIVKTVQGAEAALHCDPLRTGAVVALLEGTISNCPIVRLDWFVTKALTTLNAGFYYKWQRIKSNPRLKTLVEKVKQETATAAEKAELATIRTDEQVYYDRFGADPSFSDSANGTNRAGIFRSAVAFRKPRRVDLFFGRAARPSDAVPLVTRTLDITLDDRDPKQHAIRNLINFQDRAREVIAMLPFGFLSFALFDNFGVLQDKVPDNIAKDHTAQLPFSAELQPAVSCMRCHASDAGYKPVKNDVKHMLSKFQQAPRLDIFDDLGSKEDQIATIHRIASFYGAEQWQIDEALASARRKFAVAVRAATGASVEEMCLAAGTMQHVYLNDPIDPRVACFDLGYDVSEEWALPLYNQVLPLMPQNRFGFSPEDPIIGALRTWEPNYPIAISRLEWEQVYSDAMLRLVTAQTLSAVKERKQ